MERFERNEIQILVSTTVVEVGVNVANATVRDSPKYQSYAYGDQQQQAPKDTDEPFSHFLIIYLACKIT